MFRDNLIYFGYVEHPTESNPLAFFNYEDLTQEELEKYNNFLEHNRKVIKMCAEEADKVNSMEFEI